MTLEDLSRIAEFIAKMFNPNVETVVHDMSKKDFPILAIYNSFLSGRSVGDNSSIFGNLDYCDNRPDEVINYDFKGPAGNLFRSSSIIFNDDNGKPELALSINFDKAPIKSAIDMLNQFVKYEPYQRLGPKDKKTLFPSESELRNTVMKELIHYNKAHLSNDDISSIVLNLYKLDYFDYHGAVSVLAKSLSLSRPTIYKYLHKIK